jgi:hypothetical protein
VGPGFIQGIGGRIRRGRDVEAGDVMGALPVGVITEALV